MGGSRVLRYTQLLHRNVYVRSLNVLNHKFAFRYFRFDHVGLADNYGYFPDLSKPLLLSNYVNDIDD